MDQPHRQAMDITAPRRSSSAVRGVKLSRRQLVFAAAAVVLLAGLAGAIMWYIHRNDQTISHDRYQVVYLVTGQIYFGKLQNTTGTYLTLKNVYTIQNPSSSTTQASDTSSQSKILKVSQQVYGPDDSMAIRTDQVQFWQNLRSDSKVVRAINTSPQP